MARRLFSRRRRRRAGGLVAAALAAVAAAVFMSLAIAHPGHEEEEEDAFERWLAAVKAEGRPCDEVVEIEDSGDVVIVTCRVQTADTGDRSMAYRLPK